MSAVRIDRLVVKRSRIVCFATFPDPRLRMSTPEIAAVLTERFPTLPVHACVSEGGGVFGDVMADTPLPHVLEHLVIDVQVRAEKAVEHQAGNASGGKGSPCGQGDRLGVGVPDVAYVGTSEWIDEAAGTARIEVSFADDLVALRAFRDAAQALDAALASL